ncbi:MAG: substrate-binding domain-containing protein [Lentisphaeria bacterium]|nr:substrate-binding domain-containing protein [Lentisphaeria bacterium]
MKMGIMAFLLAAAVAVAGGCSKDNRPVKIGVSIPAATHGWTGGVVWNAEQVKAKIEQENPDVEVLLTTASTASDQADRIENLAARGVQALVVMAQEPGPVTPACETAKKQGVFLVVVSNPLEVPVQDIFVNGDNRSFGRAAAEAIGQLIGGKGDIVVMEGIPCPINTDRVESFRETLAKQYPAIRILESQAAYWNTEKGLAVMENLLQKHPEIDAVWAGDDDVMIGALKAYEESGRSDVKAMVGGGGSKATVKRIMDGDSVVKGTATYPPQMIATAVEAALAGLRNGGKAAEREIIVPSQTVTKENAAQFYFPDSIY